MGISSPLTFTTVTDDLPGHNITAQFHGRWPAYTDWLLRSERQRPLPSPAICLAQIRKHMPELLPSLERLVEAVGSPRHALQFFSLYNPPTFIAGCSQAIWRRDGEIALLRNYDFPQQRWDALQLRSNWNGTDVIAMTDCLWGVLDGTNEHGLAASLSFGGKLKVGDGFAITIVLRYILEFCSNVREAEAVLQRVPVCMAYNVALVDASGDHRIVYVGPGQQAQSSKHLCTTNHQQINDPESNLDILTDSTARLQFLNARVGDTRESLPHMQELFQQPPLYRKAQEARGWGTLYCASYLPETRSMSLIWPGQILHQSFKQYHDCQLLLGTPASVHFVEQPVGFG
jgi:predicted choloylglycine hydrolase